MWFATQTLRTAPVLTVRAVHDAPLWEPSPHWVTSANDRASERRVTDEA